MHRLLDNQNDTDIIKSVRI